MQSKSVKGEKQRGLKHLSLGKMDTILLIVLNKFLWKRLFVYWSKFHCCARSLVLLIFLCDYIKYPFSHNELSKEILCFQLRNLVDQCINPDPEQRPDITYAAEVARRMYNQSTQQAS